MTRYNVGVIGAGFVGQAVACGFSPVAKIRIYDVDPDKCTDTLKETVNRSDILFVSVPTPMNPDGSINLDIVHNVCKNIDEASERKDNVVVIKSTVVPGTTNLLKEQYPSLNFVYNPEFLTEKNPRFDFINQSRIVLGGDYRLVQRLTGLYVKRFNHCNFIKTDCTKA